MIEATITSKLMQSGFIRFNFSEGIRRFYTNEGTVDLKVNNGLIHQVYFVGIDTNKKEIIIGNHGGASKIIKFTSIKHMEIIFNKEVAQKYRQTYLSAMRKSTNNYKILREKLKSLGWRQVLSKEKNVIIVEGSYAKIKYKHYEGELETHTVKRVKFDFAKDVILVKIGNLRYTRLNSLSDITIEEDKKKKLQEVKYLDW
jgi:hypothetical protein